MSINLNELYIYIYIYKYIYFDFRPSYIKCTCGLLFFYYFITFIPISVSNWNDVCDSVFDTVGKDTQYLFYGAGVFGLRCLSLSTLCRPILIILFNRFDVFVTLASGCDGHRGKDWTPL